MKILPEIKQPGDLRRLSAAEEEKLIQEIRTVLLHTVSQNGGHLAPNLGVVELTVALHSVYDSPNDKIIWDVGHQSYVHKLLTGRFARFATLRQAGGLSGFPKREESEHDIFNTGHSSTSISAALGIAKARDLKQENYEVVAVIGDGSLTGGMALEGLNQAGHLQTNLTVILNDNEMSISPNVGALSSYLSRIRSAPTYSRVKKDVEYLVSRVPAVGPTMLKAVERLKDSLKYLVVSGILFEELGFTYLGPIEGHNLPLLKKTLLNSKKIKGPKLIHVITKKGKGYSYAEKNPDKFHGIGAFDLATGQVKKKSPFPSYTAIFGQTVLELAKKDKRIVAVTAAMSDGTGLKEFAREFPARMFDVGIAEQHAVTFAGGLAAGGLKPVAAVYSTFLQRAYDQIFHDACLQRLSLVLAIDRAGLVGEDGPTHHGIFDFAYLRHLPEITVMAPKDEGELKQMIYSAFAYSGVVAVRYPRGRALGVDIPERFTLIPKGQAEVLAEGDDLAVLAIGTMVAPALAAANELREESGMAITVVNSRFVKPLDKALILKLAVQAKALLTVEEHVKSGGFGSAILELLAENNVSCPVKLLGLPDRFIEHDKIDNLLCRCGLDKQGIKKAMAELVQRRRQNDSKQTKA
ncbi:MAG: 1-deoxy-D-xylulose-5-phosphate synthase [bacterium]